MQKKPETIFDMDFSKIMTEFKMPAMPQVDMEAALAAQRRNLEALTHANRVALEGAQAVAKRHMEIMQSSMSEMTEAMRALTSTDSPQVKAAKQADLMKTAYEKAVTNMKELADIIQKSNGEALGVINKRFTEAMDEMRGIVEKAKV